MVLSMKVQKIKGSVVIHFLMYINLIYRFQIYVIKNLPKFCRFEQIRVALLVISTSLNERKKSRLLSVVEAIRVAITFDGRKVLWYIEKEETPKLIWSSPLVCNNSRTS